MGGGKYCSFYGCLSKEKDKNVSFFKLPNKEERRNKWLEAMNRTDLIKPNLKSISYVVCSKHFKKSSIYYVPLLRPDAIPSEFVAEEELKKDIGTQTEDLSITDDDSSFETEKTDSGSETSHTDEHEIKSDTHIDKKEIKSDARINKPEIKCDEDKQEINSDARKDKQKVNFDALKDIQEINSDARKDKQEINSDTPVDDPEIKSNCHIDEKDIKSDAGIDVQKIEIEFSPTTMNPSTNISKKRKQNNSFKKSISKKKKS